MVIRYSDGSYAEGAIHELESGALRATVAGVNHAVKFTLIQNRWTSERGAVVTFEFPMERGLNRWCAAGGDGALWRTTGAGANRVN